MEVIFKEKKTAIKIYNDINLRIFDNSTPISTALVQIYLVYIAVKSGSNIKKNNNNT